MTLRFNMDILLLTILFVAVVLQFSTAVSELEPNKNRRGGSGSSGLIAFPRVGRNDPNLMSLMHEEDSATYEGDTYPSAFQDYEDMVNSEIKRSAFSRPRTGRSDPQVLNLAHLLAWKQALEKRTGPSANSAFWFGPRMGKRSVDANPIKPAEKGQPETY